MDKISGSYYFCENLTDSPLKLPDNTRLLSNSFIYAWGSEAADHMGKVFQEKIAGGETVYLMGFQGIIHNSGVSLLEVSKRFGIRVLGNYEEERFVGEKHFAGYPSQSVGEAKRQLAKMGKSARDIFAIFHGWDMVKLEKNYQELRMNMAKSKMASNSLDDYMLLSVISKEAQKDIFDPGRKNFYVYSPLLVRMVEQLRSDLEVDPQIPCIQMSHHENHAYFSYGVSPFCDETHYNTPTIIACVDGNGDICSTSLYVATGAKIRLIKRLSFLDSLGNFYGFLSAFLGGWSALSAEGRYMGAAAWGNGSRLTNPYYKQLRQYFHFAKKGDVYANRALIENEYENLQKIVGPFVPKEQLWNPDAVLNVDNIQHSKITRERVDIAAAVQMVFEDALFHIIGFLIGETGSDQLVLCGGTALNCVANMRLLEQFDGVYYQRYLDRDTRLHLWVPPVPSDQGVVLGAPYQFAMRNKVKPPGKLLSPFLCGLPPSTQHIQRMLEDTDFVSSEKLGNTNNEHILEKLADWMAYIVSQNGIIGVFQGEAETGPRALGHRSILSNPCDPDSMEKLNSRVKLRERIRPLAPMVTLDAAKEWFNLSPGAGLHDYDAYDYMVLTVAAKEKARSVVPAVIHYDGTSRIQIVRKENNLLVFAYLKALKNYIGVEISINTSLNVGSPIVQTPFQAVEIFKRAKGMDAIFMIGETGEVFMVWAKEGVQEYSSRILEIKKRYQATLENEDFNRERSDLWTTNEKY